MSTGKVENISSSQEATGGFIIPLPGVAWVSWPNVETVEQALLILRMTKPQDRLLGEIKLKIEGEDE